MKVTIAKLRTSIQYTFSKTYFIYMDSFYENYEYWMKSRPDLEFDVYNISFDESKPARNEEAIKTADVVIIPSESEWRYQRPDLWEGKHTVSLGESYKGHRDKTNKQLDEIRPYFENKRIIFWRCERADTEELYRTKVFCDTPIKSFDIIDEIDFSGNINGMRYHHIPNLQKELNCDRTKTIDFAYWGSAWKDDRDKIIHGVYENKDFTTMLVGGWSYLKEDVNNQIKPWARDWRDLYPLLKPARSTCCFNWLDENATTSRYVEALAIGIIPFVWCSQNFQYDKNNTYNIDVWQRVGSVEELLWKIEWLRDDDFFKAKLREYRKNYRKVLLSKKQYSEEFNKKMDALT